GGGGDDVVGGVEHLDGDAVEAALAGILDAVAVAVEPHPVTHGGGALVAEVDVGPGVAGGERQGGDVRRGDAVEVEGRSRPRGRRHPDRIRAGRQAAERVVAVAAGDGGGDDVVGGVEQLDGDAVEAALAGVLEAVAVGVDPYPVADGSRGGVRSLVA